MNPEEQTAIQDRQIRIFISSTFRDMRADRDYLVKFIFPQLRKLCESRGVAWGEVDLRWGVTDEQAAEGKVLPICLEEIKRCRPYFIGLLGERYGWIPETLPADLVEQEKWLEEHLHGKTSVTELEILHGVLNDPKMAGQAFFYFRDPAYVKSIPEKGRKDFIAENAADAEKVRNLKEKIRHSGFPVHENYPSPEALGGLVLADLTRVVNDLFSEGSLPAPLDRESMDHEAYAKSRELVYIGRQECFDRLDTHAASNGTLPLVILGESGSGKSALLANWVARYRQAYPDALVLQHYIGATPYSSDWAATLRRLMGESKRRLGLQQDIPDQPDALRSVFPNWLHMAAVKGRIVLVLDALNQLEDRDGAPDLVWLPTVLPENVRLIISTLPGRPLDEIQKRHWPTLKVELLSADERRKLIAEYLAQHAKSLNAARVERIATAPPSANPLYLRVLLDELRLVRTHEELEERIGDYLKAESPYALYEKVIARWEQDYEGDSDLVGDALSLLWAARQGLTETELLQALSKDDEPLPRAKWSPLFLAMSDALISRGGLLTFAHDFLRTAVKNAYAPTECHQQQAHLQLADYFERQAACPRRIDELPWQLAAAKAWNRLSGLLNSRSFLTEAWKRNQLEVVTYWKRIETSSNLRIKDVCRDLINHPDTEPDKELLWTLANLLRCTGHEESTEPIINHLVTYYRTLCDLNDLSNTLGTEGGILRPDDRRDIQTIKQLNNAGRLASLLHFQASLLNRRGDSSSAGRLSREADDITNRFSMDFMADKGAALIQQAYLLLQQGGELDEVMELSQMALRLFCGIFWTGGNLPDTEQVATALHLQAVILHKKDDLNGAMEKLKQSEKILRLLDKRDQLADLLSFQALILQERGTWNDAMVLVKEAERIWRRLYDQDKLVSSLGTQGNILQECGKLEEALVKYSEAEESLREENSHLRISLLFNKGSLLYRMRRFHESLPVLEKAHQLAVMHNATALAKQIQGVLVKVLMEVQSTGVTGLRTATPEVPSIPCKQSIKDLRTSAMTALENGLWEAAETCYEKLLQQGDPVETVAPGLITALLNAHETISPATITRIQTLIAQLESTGQTTLAKELRFKHSTKLNIAGPKKPWWKFG